jgi:hypothetical protein
MQARFLSSPTKTGMESRIDRKLFPRKAAAGVPHHGIKFQVQQENSIQIGFLYLIYFFLFTN